MQAAFALVRCMRALVPTSVPPRSLTRCGPIANPNSSSAASTCAGEAPSRSRLLGLSKIAVEHHPIPDETESYETWHRNSLEQLCDLKLQIPSLRARSRPSARFTEELCHIPAGLKKCRPRTRPGCRVARPSSVTERVEVFVAISRSGVKDGIKRGQNLLLQIHILEHGFDCDVGVRCGSKGVAAGDSRRSRSSAVLRPMLPRWTRDS